MFSNPIRLLREAWRDPWALAQELYVMSTSREPRTVPAPVTIEVGPGQTALKLVRTTETQPSTSASVTRISQQAGPAASPDRAARIARETERTREPSPWELPEPIKPITSDIGPASRPATNDIAPPRSPSSRDDARSATEAYRPPDLPVRRPPPDSPGHNAPTRTGRFTPSGPLPPRPAVVDGGQVSKPQPGSRQPYRAPLFEVHGEVRFGGSRPVQFDAPPLVYSPITASYEPLRWDVPPTHIPDARTESAGGILGKVTGDSGEGQWRVSLYPNGPDTADSDQIHAVVKILNMDPSEKAPTGWWIEGIFSFDGGDGTEYCYCPDLWLE